MKSMKKLSLIAAILTALFLLSAGCAATTTPKNSQNVPGGALPSGTGGTQGIITEVSTTSITIAVIPAGTTPQGGDRNMPQGTAPQGTAPQGTAPQGAAPQGAQSFDTSSWQKMTFSIDGSTKIVQGQAPGASGGAKASTLKASDLKVGGSVTITAQSGQADAADQITVMQGMGGIPGGGPQGNAPAPSATAKS